jgi:hypothetical protein
LFGDTVAVIDDVAPIVSERDELDTLIPETNIEDLILLVAMTESRL